MVQANIPTKAGRPAHKPTAETRRAVATMAGAGLRQSEIAAAIGISEPTLRKCYGDALEQAAASMVGKVAARLVDIALNAPPREATTAIIFYLKCRGGWKPAPETEIHVSQQSAAPVVTLTPYHDAAIK